MKIKNWLSSLAILGILVSPIKATDIALAPKETEVKEEIRFEKLEEALKFEDGTRININVYDGEYGLNISRMEKKGMYGVGKDAVLNTTFLLSNDTELINLKIKAPNDNITPQDAVVLSKDSNDEYIRDVRIEKCNIYGNGVNTLTIAWKNLENIVIKDNLITNPSSNAIMVAYDISEGKPVIEGNTLQDSYIGIKTYDTTKLDLNERNIFTRNKWNMEVKQLTDFSHLAINQYWFNETGKQLLTEEDILKTISVLETNLSTASISTSNMKLEEEVIKPIEVIPCHTDSPYVIFHPTPTSANNVWTMY